MSETRPRRALLVALAAVTCIGFALWLLSERTSVDPSASATPSWSASPPIAPSFTAPLPEVATEPPSMALPLPTSTRVEPVSIPAPPIHPLEDPRDPHKWIRGQVVRAPTESPVIGAMVYSNLGVPTPGGRTQAPDGRFEIWAPQFTDALLVHVGDTEPEQSFPVEPGTMDIDGVRLVCDSSFAGLAGVVRGPGGEPIAGASVDLWCLDTLEKIGKQTLSDGTYRAVRIEAGRYDVTVAESHSHGKPMPSLAPQRIRGVVISANAITELNVTLQPGLTIRGRVTDKAGSPVHRARVWLEFADNQSEELEQQEQEIGLVALEWMTAAGSASDGIGQELMSFDVPSTTTDEHGNFVLTGVPADEIQLRTKAAGFCETRTPLSLRRGDVSDVQLVLDAGLELSGTIVDEQGSPVKSGVVVLVADGLGWPRIQAMASIDSDGRFTISGLSAGPCQLLLAHGDNGASLILDHAVEPGGEPQTYVAHR